MAVTVRGAVRELLDQTMVTMDALLEASDRELPMSSSHPCAQGKDLWTLITNDIDCCIDGAGGAPGRGAESGEVMFRHEGLYPVFYEAAGRVKYASCPPRDFVFSVLPLSDRLSVSRASPGPQALARRLLQARGAAGGEGRVGLRTRQPRALQPSGAGLLLFFGPTLEPAGPRAHALSVSRAGERRQPLAQSHVRAAVCLGVRRRIDAPRHGFRERLRYRPSRGERALDLHGTIRTDSEPGPDPI